MNREIALRHKLNRAINFAQANYGSSISLDQMAEVACLSKFRFAHVFQERVQEAPYSFLHRTRLEYAARSLLHHTTKPITAIALDCGFGSPQAFSSAFNKRFGLTPKQFRHKKQHFPMSFVGTSQLEKAIIERTKLVNMPSRRLAYVRRFGAYFNSNGANTRTSLLMAEWARERGLWSSNAVCVGVCPNSAQLTPPDQCIYDVGHQVPDDIVEDDLVSIQEIPAGRYAVLYVECTSLQLNYFWNWLVFRWLPQSGETYELENCYELFSPGECGVVSPQLGVELCLRLKPG